MVTHVNKCVFMFIFLASLSRFALGQELYITKEIEYQTEDGWTISGTLRLPLDADVKNEYPAILLLHEEEHDRHDFVGIGDPGLAQKLPLAGMVSLVIDLRGRGLSMGKGQPVNSERHDFSTIINEQMYLDITAGMEFLADYPGVDGLRIGLLALQYSAEPAVRAMQKTTIPTRALVIIGGTNMSQESKDYLASTDIPILTGANVVDRSMLKQMVDIYANSKNPYSWVFTPHPGERGYTNSSRILNESSDEESRTDYTIKWFGTHVKGLGRNKAITVTTSDGFTIHGNFRYPDDLGKNGMKIPGVVIAPGGRSNRDSYFRFEEDMVRRGIAVVSVEQRGRGQSMMGKSVEDPEIAKLWEEDPTESPYYLDVIAGIDYLVAQAGIDPNNIGLMGGARGSRNAILAAAQDPDRVKAMVLLTVYYEDDMEQILPKLEASTLLIATEHRSKDRAIQVHRAMKNSDLLIYPGDGQTHHIREIEPGIVDDVGNFMERELYK